MNKMTDRFTKGLHLSFIAALVAVLALGAASVANAIGPWTNGQAATLVLGQPDFTTDTSDTTASTMHHPTDVAVDPATGKVFVAEQGNNRVLRFASGAALVNGGAAEAVLGQPDFTTNTPGTTASTMNMPYGVFADSGGRLWVSEFANHRVLRFDNAAAKANGANADGVLGQANFTSNAAATTQNGMNQPGGVTVAGSGVLFVADVSNNRVLRFDNAAAKANGANADGVLGQANFTSNAAATTQNGMKYPYGVGYDDEGRLYVADAANHRILIFNNGATLANGANADNVLGQADFTTGTPNTGGISASTLNQPAKVFADNSVGALWAAEFGNNRVLRYMTPTAPQPEPHPVGGIVVPVDKVGLVAPWMGLVALVSLAAFTVAVVRRRRG
jgi:sugar lactone lactonase YvrE